MIVLLVRASRYFYKSRGHGCTAIGEVAALTYGWEALGKLMQLSGDCSHEHHDR
jgi:hypothetical protein